jgi:hypothetical protein
MDQIKYFLFGIIITTMLFLTWKVNVLEAKLIKIEQQGLQQNKSVDDTMTKFFDLVIELKKMEKDEIDKWEKVN